MCCGMLRIPQVHEGRLGVMRSHSSCPVRVRLRLGDCSWKGARSESGQHYISFRLQRAAVSFSCGDEVVNALFQNVPLATITSLFALETEFEPKIQRHILSHYNCLIVSWGFPSSSISSCLPALIFSPLPLPSPTFFFVIIIIWFGNNSLHIYIIIPLAGVEFIFLEGSLVVEVIFPKIIFS